ncbi:MAG TPA: HAMP domain-containing sensor histidine kinase [Gemmatimonadales bacterium]
MPLCVQQAAVRRLLTEWPATLGAPPRSATITDHMVILMATLGEMQVTPDAVIDPRAHSPLARRLLGALRTELLDGSKEHDVSDSDLGRLLVAFERVREAIEPDPAETFAAQLAGSDGLRLLVDVAHDLRSPLTSILFLAEAMQRGQSGPVTDVQRRQLGLIYTAALGLSSVASDIIDLTRAELLVEHQPIPFSVGGVLESVQDIVRPIAEEKQLALRVTPPQVDQRLGHPVALSRVLLNLTTNALKFTSQGYVEIVVRELTPDRVEVSVHDSGGGIDPAILPTLFDPVRRRSRDAGRDEYSKLFSQTGLGLTICRKLVATMGSELQVESRQGWGTRFSFELDLPVSRRSGEQETPPPAAPERHDGRRNRRRSPRL